MRRLLTTVAFSVLMLGVTAPGWAADPATGSSATQATPSSPITPSAQSKQTMPSNQATASTPSTSTQSSAGAATTGKQAADTTAKTGTAPQKVVHHARASSRSDHMANELNRQELAKIAAGTNTSYGSSK